MEISNERLQHLADLAKFPNPTEEMTIAEELLQARQQLEALRSRVCQNCNYWDKALCSYWDSRVDNPDFGCEGFIPLSAQPEEA